MVQRRQRHRQPRRPDRAAAEMAEVGIERFGAGDDQKHRAERQQRDDPMAGQETHAMDRVEGVQHRRVLSDMPDAGGRNGNEPDQRDRTEERRHLRGAAELDREQPDEDHHCEGHHIRLERRRHHFQPLRGGEHRQGWRDDRVAVEQSAADDAEQDDGARARGQRHQRQRATLAVVIGAQQNENVLESDDDDQCPDDQR